MARGLKAGAIGRTGRGNFGHGLHTCYGEVDGIDLVAVADEDEDGRAKAVADTGAERAYADYREMLACEDLDVVSVCPRWVDCHEEMITDALDSGCHVYSEKPMTSAPDAADGIIALADSKNLKIAVAHQAAYLPQVREALRIVADGQIGRLRRMVAAGKMDHRGGGEDMIVLGTHLFNLMRIVAGDPAGVSGRVTVDGQRITPSDVREAGEPVGFIAGDRVHGHFAFSNDVTATFDSWRREERNGRPYGLVIQGESGAIAFDASASQVAMLEDDAIAHWESGQVWEPLDLDPVPLMGGNALAIRDLIDAVEEDRDPISSARGARTALEMILGIYASEVAGGAHISLPLEDRRHPLDVWTVRG